MLPPSPYRRLARSAPRLRSRRSPRVRAALAAAVLAMLPFVWSEDASCDGKPQRLISGLEILFGHGGDALAPGMVFFALVITAVGLAFAAARTARPGRRLAAEAVGSVAALGTFGMTFLMMHHGRVDQPLDHPAAWIGTLAAFGIALQSWFLTGAAVRRALEAWRVRRAALRAARRGGFTKAARGRSRFAEPVASGLPGDVLWAEAEREAGAEHEAMTVRKQRASL